MPDFRRRLDRVPPQGHLAFNIVWRDKSLDLTRTDGTRDVEPEVLAMAGYVGRLRLFPRSCPVYVGPRWEFNCDRCGRLRRCLYARWVGDCFACRECHQLTYASAQQWDNIKRVGWLESLERLLRRDDERLRRLG